MAELNKPTSMIRRILLRGADLMIKLDGVPPENVAAYRAQFVRVMEQAINDSIGTDILPLSGWSIVPSERQARRERIIAALRNGEKPQAIASRELVTVRTVQLVRAEVAKTYPLNISP